jgi:hypothetical protein
VDDGDATKVIKFQASGITTGTTRTMTAPDANGVWVVPFTCTGTDKLSAISATGVTTCSADAGGAGAGDNTTVNGSATTDDNFNDTLPAAPANSINVKWQLDTVAAPDNVSAYIPYCRAPHGRRAGTSRRRTPPPRRTPTPTRRSTPRARAT